MKMVYSFTDNQTIKDEAVDWLIRLDGDQPPDDQALVELQEWRDRSPRHREQLSQLAVMWDNLNVLTELAVPLAEPERRQRKEPWFASPQSFFPAAAVTAALIAAVLLAFQFVPGAIDQTNGVYTTAIGQQSQIILADGSRLELNTNSEIRVAYGEQYRDIYLVHGEAHFDVAKNKDKPLRVLAGRGRVQAIGTAFSVYLQGQNVRVTVTEGRVSLAGAHEEPLSNDGLLAVDFLNQQGQLIESQSMADLGTLIAGQGATIKSLPSSTGTIESVTVLEDVKIYGRDELNQRLSWRQGLLVFTGETLEQVVEEISRYTTVAIEIPEVEVRAIRVGGQFAVGDTEMMLNALEDTFALRIERDGNNHVQILAAKD